jgi:hypothetical protein
MESAIAGAMLLALPIMELLFGPGSLDALYEATGIVAVALLIAAAAVLVRSVSGLEPRHQSEG